MINICPPKLFKTVASFCILLVFYSCTKMGLNPQGENMSDHLLNNSTSTLTITGDATQEFDPHYEDSLERETLLGMKLTNPYLIPNMQQAYSNLGLDASKAEVNHLYVRFLPNGVEQLNKLDSTMEAKALELFDTPVDHEVLYQGDYYHDPLIPGENITWQYAVVPPTFIFPNGIQHETLAQIHIPSDNYTSVETEAERLAAIQDSISTYLAGGVVYPQVLPCEPGYEWSFRLHKCVPILDPPHSCPPDYHWDEELKTCISDNPPSPAADAAKPAGYIKVFDTNLDESLPVIKARVVAKRWFKVERTYTDNNGHFQFGKRFKNKVKINVKFKNEYAQIRKLRGIRLWQMLFPVKATLGVFSGNKSAINHTFSTYPDRAAKGNTYWIAATAHNAVQEYRDLANSELIGLPPTDLKIILTNWGAGGSAPMFAKRGVNDFPLEYIAWNLSPPIAIVSAVAFTLKQQIDITASYSLMKMSNLTSDRVKETMYHELTHAAHFQKLGNSWYTSFVNMELMAIVSNMAPAYSPYGDGSNSTFSPIIALGEGWAYYMGHYLADRTYGANSSSQPEQGNWYNNGFPVPALNSHINLLEDFSPFRTNDPFHWIPQGLFFDLMDTRNDNQFNLQQVVDNVSGFTNQKLFNAFKNNIFTMQDYRLKLIEQNPNNQSLEITNLFSQYDY